MSSSTENSKNKKNGKTLENIIDEELEEDIREVFREEEIKPENEIHYQKDNNNLGLNTDQQESDNNEETLSEGESDLDRELEEELDKQLANKIETSDNDEIIDNEMMKKIDSSYTLQDMDVSVDEFYSEKHNLPKFKILRGDKVRSKSLYFQPRDLMTLVVENTGDWSWTSVEMQDTKDQPRYSVKSGGMSHEWVTRIQNTRTFGEWKLIISGPLLRNEDEFEVIIPIHVIKDRYEAWKQISSNGDTRKSLKSRQVVKVEINNKFSFEILVNRMDVLVNQYVEPNLKEFDYIEIIGQIDIEIEYETLKDLIDYKRVPQITELSIIEEIPGVKDLPPIPITEIKGIGKTYADRLQTIGVEYVDQLYSTSIPKVIEVSKASETRVNGWFEQIEDLLEQPKDEIAEKVEVVSDEPGISGDLPADKIKGIGPATLKKLEAINYRTIKDVADADPEELATKLNRSTSFVMGWISDAQMKLYNKVEIETDKKEELSPEQIDKLGKMSVRDIKGIGPKTEEKLNEGGFGTYQKLADSDPATINKITGLSETKLRKWISAAQLKLYGKVDL